MSLRRVKVLSENEKETVRIVGQVKWFDPVKGFGFVVSESGGPDILLHANVLRNFGQSSVADAARVEIGIQETSRGVQAVEVYRIDVPDAAATAGLADFVDLDPDEMANAPLEPARVKWFDKGKGFGFANVFGRGEDVFVHIEVLRQSGLSDLQPGEALALRVIDGKRGRMATEVMAWESAVTRDD
ncbi:cold-shock protein [Shimia sediminis]|uniref:cold-shock protein n=1 Tax=Shimia sediminis TaxID=2497945 RepID=UPI000F8C7C91|nr:cold shock domain-containing protein [Shimia sediminis]